MNKLFFLLSVLLFPAVLSAQIARPVKSGSMYKQLRSMETGPWEFSPEGWYYSWFKKTIIKEGNFIGIKIPEVKITLPGAGIHDRGPAGTGIIGDGYVRKYKPNAQARAKMLALAELSRKQYETVAEYHKKIGDRELLDAADRKVDLAIRVYKGRISLLKDNIRSMCSTLTALSSSSEEYALVAHYTGILSRIEESITTISKAYITNADRSKAYLKEIENLKKLHRQSKYSCKRSYASKRYKAPLS